MSKRFIDTEKYKKPFLRSLKGPYKLLWDYICLTCNHAGVWQVDFEIAQVYLGLDMPVEETVAIQCFNADEERIIVIDAGKKWFIKPFVDFQYGELNPANRVHLSVLSELEKEGIEYNSIKGLTSPLLGAMDKDKDKAKDKEKKRGTGGETAFSLPDWIDLTTWTTYLQVRKAKRAAQTPHALSLIIADLEKFKAEGQDVKLILENSVKSGWAGVFPLRQDSKKASKGCAPIPGKYDGLGVQV